MMSKDVGKEVARAVNDVAEGGLIDDLQLVAYQSGASYELVDMIGTYVHRGHAYVGVPPTSLHHAEAKRLEYGTADAPPAAFVRSTVARQQRDLEEAFGAALTRRLFGGMS